MIEQAVPRGTPDEPLDRLEEAIVFAIAEARRLRRETRERRAKMGRVQGGERGGEAA